MLVARCISEAHRGPLRAHFAALDPADLHLRFGMHCSAQMLDAYVAGIDFRRAVVLGVFGEELQLVGVAHLSCEEADCELGLSVLQAWRRRGIGARLLRRAMQRARLMGADRLVMHCLRDNTALLRLVFRAGAEVVARAGEADGVIKLPASLPYDGWGELAEEQWAAIDFGIKVQQLVARRALRLAPAA